jgi:hypothetical protein
MPDDLIEAGQVLGNDGAFQADWLDTAFPGDEHKELRENAVLKDTKDVRSMARRVVDSQSQIGKLTGGRDFAILPNEHSTPEEITAFHTKMGRPKTAAEYGYGEAEGANKEYAEKISNALHAAGASKSVADVLLKAQNEWVAEQKAKQEVENKIADAKGDKAIRDHFGSTYDAEMANARLTITALATKVSAEYAQELSEAVKYEPNTAKFLALVGGLVAEDPGLKSATGSANFSPTDARAKASELRNDPYFLSEQPTGPDGNLMPRNKIKHDALIKEIDDLTKMATQ